jgi:hypothetical protein
MAIELTADRAALFDQASALLVEIAGDEPIHAEMNARNGQGEPLKYGPVRRVFTLEDARAHLTGRKTKAARLLRADGLTRALCFDADADASWCTLRQAGHVLAEAGYLLICEDSPAGRGGHLWLVYSELVRSSDALRHVRALAPELATIEEYWPHRRQSVRLPGGVYVTPTLREQCKLYDALGGLLAETRAEAAEALLWMQTPARLVPAYPPEPEQPKLLAARPVVLASAPAVPGAETRFTLAQLAAWFNARHSLENIHPLETATHARAVWRAEKGRPSVSYLGQRWYDHGHAEQRSGDALDLFILVSGRDRKEVLRELGREYRAELIGGNGQIVSSTDRPEAMRAESPPKEETAGRPGGLPASAQPAQVLSQEERRRRYAM